MVMERSRSDRRGGASLVRTCLGCIVGFGWVTAVPSLGAQTTIHYEGGVFVTTGRYIFTERSTGWTLSSGLAIDAGPITVRAVVPLLVQNTTLLTSSSGGMLPTGGTESAAVADSVASRSGHGDGRGTGNLDVTGATLFGVEGTPVVADGQVEVPTTALTGYRAVVGDPTVSVNLALGRASRTRVLLGVGAKVPVADSASFGTGEWDVGGSVSVSRRLGSSVLFGLDVSYWHLGDLAALDLRDPVLASASLAYLSLSGWVTSAAVMGARSVIEGFGDTYLVSAGVSKVGSAGAVGVTASLGLSETAPDLACGITWRLGLLPRR
jgi:hypothetical protein